MSLREAAKPKLDVIPKGWETCEQIAEKENLSVAWTSQMLRKCIKEKTYEMKKFRAHAGSRIMPVPHYREVGKRK